MLTKLQVAYDKFGGWLGVLSNIILVGAMLLTVINVLLRRFGTPFAGTSKVVGFSSATLTGLALVYSRSAKPLLRSTLSPPISIGESAQSFWG